MNRLCATTLAMSLCAMQLPAVDVSDELLARLAYVESRNDPGAFDRDGGSFGLYQIRMPYLEDANRLLGTSYTLCDMFDPEKAKAVVRAYLGHWGAEFARRKGRPPTDEELARIHNGGPRGADRKSTLGYAKLYREAPCGREELK